MKIINTELLKPRNVIIIGAIALAVRLLMQPVMKMIDNTGNPANSNPQG